MGLVYSQNFAVGAGTSLIPTTGYHYRRSNTWAVGGGTSVAPDTNYPHVVITEDVNIAVGIGPAGENCIDAGNEGYTPDYSSCRCQFARVGSLTSPFGSTGWWDASQGRLKASWKFTAWNTDSVGFGRYVWASLLYVADGANSGFIELYIGNYGDEVNPDYRLVLDATLDGGSVHEDSVTVSQGATDNQWQDFEIQWQCGTPSGSPGVDSFANDGWLKVYWNGTLIYTLSSISLYVNAGFDQQENGTSVPTGTSTTPANYARVLALGNFYEFIGPATNLELYDDLVVPEPEPEPASAFQVWSNHPLPDPSDYYGGWKEPRVIAWGQVRRALSSFIDGQYESSDFRVTLADVDRLIRQLAEDDRLLNSDIVVRTIDDVRRRLKEVPRVLYRGLLREATPGSQLTYEFTIKDIFAEQFSATDTLIPQRTIDITDFVNCGQTKVHSSATSYQNAYNYLTVNDDGHPVESVEDPPGTFNDVEVSKVYIDGGYGQFAAGDQIQFSNHTQIYTVNDSSWTDPETWIEISPTLQFGPFFNHAANITTLDTRDVEPARGKRVPIWYGVITDRVMSGSVDEGDGQATPIYVGDKGLSDGKTYGEFLWAGHACYDAGTGGPFKMLYFLNEAVDNLAAASHGFWVDNKLKAITFGDLATEAGAGGRICMPGYDNWIANGFTTPYVEHGGRRYTVLYLRGIFRDWALKIARGPDNMNWQGGGDQTTFAVCAYGCETVGDGSGSLILRGLQQYKHIIQNWCPPRGSGYQGGAWLSTPTFADDPLLPMIDEGSFDRADAQSEVYVPGGFVGHFGIGVNNEAITARTLIARLNTSFAVESGFNRKAQFFVNMINRNLSTTALKDPLTYIRDIFEGTFAIESLMRDVYTAINFQHTQDYLGRASSGWRSQLLTSEQVENTAATSDYGAKTVYSTLQLYMLRGKNRASDPDDYITGSATIAAVLAIKLARLSRVQYIVKFQTGPGGFDYELGDIVPVTHYEGLSSNGYVARPLRIERIELDPGQYTTTLECYDMENMWE